LFGVVRSLIAAVLLFTSPGTPMILMGQEVSSCNSFLLMGVESGAAVPGVAHAALS
jgi:hypothetical protein